MLLKLNDAEKPPLFPLAIVLLISAVVKTGGGAGDILSGRSEPEVGLILHAGRLYPYPEEDIPSGFSVHQDSASRSIPLFILPGLPQVSELNARTV